MLLVTLIAILRLLRLLSRYGAAVAVKCTVILLLVTAFSSHNSVPSGEKMLEAARFAAAATWLRAWSKTSRRGVINYLPFSRQNSENALTSGIPSNAGW